MPRSSRLRAEIAAAKAANEARPDTHDYSEAETRALIIDVLLKEAGWPLDQPRDREYQVTGMPTPIGRPATSTTCCGATTGCRSAWSRRSGRRESAQAGQQQAKLYADCLEQQSGRRPVIFYTNGYEHWHLGRRRAIRRARSRASTPATSWNC